MSPDVSEKFSKFIDMRDFNRSSDWRLSAASRRRNDSLGFSRATRKVSCPVCGESGHEPVGSIHGFTWVSCSGCTHVYTQNIPDEDRLKSFYDHRLRSPEMRPGEDLLNQDLYMTRVEKMAAPKVAYISESIGEQRGRWVDIGCGVGEVVLAASRTGWDAVGYDIDPQQIELAQAFGANVIRAFIDDNNARKILAGASVVSMMNLLEHLPDPMGVLGMVCENIDRDARLVFELPRFYSLSSFTNMSFPDLTSRHMIAPNHLMLFTDKSLTCMLDRVGCQATHIWYYGQDVYELLGTVATLAKIQCHELTDRLFDAIGRLQKVIDQAKLCDEMLIIAEKA